MELFLEEMHYVAPGDRARTNVRNSADLCSISRNSCQSNKNKTYPMEVWVPSVEICSQKLVTISHRGCRNYFHN